MIKVVAGWINEDKNNRLNMIKVTAGWKNENKDNKLINSNVNFEYLFLSFLIRLLGLFLIYLINLLLIL